jgi:hypothetical protein
VNDLGAPDSLDPVEELTRDELGFQQQHFESLDAKAGIVLGFAAAVVALSADATAGAFVTALLHTVATSAAGLASLVSIASFWPRKFRTLDVKQVRDDTLGRLPDSLTRVAILDTRVRIIEANRTLLEQKARRLKTGATLLVTAVILIGAGSMVERLEGEAMSTPRAPATSSSMRRSANSRASAAKSPEMEMKNQARSTMMLRLTRESPIINHITGAAPTANINDLDCVTMSMRVRARCAAECSTQPGSEKSLNGSGAPGH